MNEKELINKYQSRLFNKLFSTLPIIRKFNKTTNKLNLDEPLTHFYAFGNKKFWFSKGEKENKFIFIFSIKNKALQDIKQDDATLIVDFDKDKQFNNTSLGMFSISNSKIHILINYDILKKRYPYFNTGDFKISKFKSIDTNLNLNVIDLGNLDGDFLENLEKLIQLSSVLEILDDEEVEKSDKITNKRDTIPKSQQCYICLKDKNKIKINSNLNSLKNLKPELCGRCIEKIVASEFYTKLVPLLRGNETKDLNIARERFGNAETFDIGLKLLEKYDIIKYIGIKKLFFTIEKDPYLVAKYIKYSDENNLLIDNIFKAKKSPKKKKQKNIDNRTTNLTKETTQKMNLFLNALNAGKTHEQACRIAKIDSTKVENWYKYGKKGDVNYVPFYRKYKPLKPENKDRMEKMEKFTNALKKDANIEHALKVSSLDIDKVRAWYGLGEKGDEDYKDFYLACKILLPNGIPKNETKKIVNNSELMNEFIALIEAGKTNDEAITQLRIPKFKVKNWVNQGKLGNEKYVNFYNAYMIEVEKERQHKKAKKLEKQLKKQNINETTKEIAIDLHGEKILPTDERTCKLCGRKLSKKTKKDICKRCLRKQYASKILLRLLESVEPEKSFRKEDLKALGLQNIQIKDYIWTLKEYNLLTEENYKLQLINKNELESFIKDSGLEINELPQGESAVKLNKTCKTCGETLEISKFFTSATTEDGFEDNCKDCKRLIAAANYLKEITEFVDYESEFSEDELKPHFKNSFQLQAKIWALLDNDLLKKDFETDTYILTDEKTANEFLDKYYQEIEKPAKNQLSEKPVPIEYTKKDQMNIIIQAIGNGKSRTEAAEIANIPLYKINHWYTEGRQGYGKDNVNFYKQLKRLEENISKNKPVNNREIKKEEYENKEINRRIFLDNFKNGKTKEESAKNADIELSLVHEWYLKGKNNEKPYNEFYERYIEIKNGNAEIEIPKLDKTDQFGSNIAVNQMNTILESLANGKSEKEAINEANISENTYKYWINRGKQGFGELYTQFYHYVNEIKKRDKSTETPFNEWETKLNELLVPLDEKYEFFFKSSKMNRTGIAWVNIIGKQWVYQKTHENYPLKLSNSNIYKLYQEVKKNNLPWGIRDLNLAKPLILEYYELNPENATPRPVNIEKITQRIDDPGIYAPLPEKYEQAFKSNPMNKSGIAWVNNPGTGTKWIYERRFNGKTVRFDDTNIYELYKKVKMANQIWGIRDYERAKKIIDIPDDFEIPQKQITIDKSKIIPEFIDPDIYAPLPEELSFSFNPSQQNKTGIAWVNKSGSNWRYSRQIDGQPVEVIDENIYELHKKVKNLNYDWGIRDYKKAKEIIKIPNNYVPTRSENSLNELSNDIYAPLPKKYLNSFNPNQPNKTGIAWVNQIGNKWVYQRKVKGIPIKFSDPDIKKLHEVVIKNNHVWGIINFEKAKKIIKTNVIPTTIKEEPQEIKPIITSKNVTVTYIEKSINEIDVIIKGMIKNNDLINIVNRLDSFEENIQRIITTSINHQVDLFIELNIYKYELRRFEEKINDLGWKINK